MKYEKLFGYPDKQAVQSKLQTVMQAKQIGYKEMAEIMGVTARTVEYWVKAERNMSWTAYYLLERIERETLTGQ